MTNISKQKLLQKLNRKKIQQNGKISKILENNDKFMEIIKTDLEKKIEKKKQTKAGCQIRKEN